MTRNEETMNKSERTPEEIAEEIALFAFAVDKPKHIFNPHEQLLRFSDTCDLIASAIKEQVSELEVKLRESENERLRLAEHAHCISEDKTLAHGSFGYCMQCYRILQEQVAERDTEIERLKNFNGTTEFSTLTPPEILHKEYKRGFDEGYAQGDVSEEGLERKELEAKLSKKSAEVERLLDVIKKVNSRIIGHLVDVEVESRKLNLIEAQKLCVTILEETKP